MSAEQRRQLLGQPKNYPLRASFLGKIGLLSSEEVAFLLSHEVDLDVDDRHVGEILPVLQWSNTEPAVPGPPVTRVPTWYLLPVAGVIVLTWALLKHAARLLFSRQ